MPCHDQQLSRRQTVHFPLAHFAVRCGAVRSLAKSNGKRPNGNRARNMIRMRIRMRMEWEWNERKGKGKGKEYMRPNPTQWNRTEREKEQKETPHAKPTTMDNTRLIQHSKCAMTFIWDGTQFHVIHHMLQCNVMWYNVVDKAEAETETEWRQVKVKGSLHGPWKCANPPVPCVWLFSQCNCKAAVHVVFWPSAATVQLNE